ncbi:MarR family winged helix-turn-helix transcriptional regulator [Streptomyces sp. NPDC056296]|uniref:MarR family winged helix-turn-helix transcriptional regulator n=1 Tax=Streptomyces sp. NPDC056296 TaxID=3345775 RepID=UPI0035D6B3BE
MPVSPQDALDGARLTSEEREFWYAWKRAQEAVRTRVLEDVTVATGLSGADIGILIRIDDAGGALRQNQLATSLGWDRTRLSHQLTRMETRELLARTKVPGGVEVGMRPAGQTAIETARPIHASAVRNHLIAPMGARLPEIQELLEALAAPRQ